MIFQTVIFRFYVDLRGCNNCLSLVPRLDCQDVANNALWKPLLFKHLLRLQFLRFPNTQRYQSYDYLGGGFNYFLCSIYLGKIPILTNIFQMGWSHQLAMTRAFWMTRERSPQLLSFCCLKTSYRWCFRKVISTFGTFWMYKTLSQKTT